MTFTGAEPLEINIPVIIAASGEKVTLDKTIWSDKEIEPVFYAGEKGPYLIVDLCDTNGRALVDLKASLIISSNGGDAFQKNLFAKPEASIA